MKPARPKASPELPRVHLAAVEALTHAMDAARGHALEELEARAAARALRALARPLAPTRVQ